MGETTLNIEPIDASFGAYIHDIQLAQVTDATFAALREAWVEYGLLVFHDQSLSKSEQDDFARRFGPLEFGAAAISNLDKFDRIHADSDDDLVKSLRGNEGWHHDSTYMPVQAMGAVFSAEIVPPSGSSTGFADTRAAYDALDQATKDQLAGMQAYHSLEYSQGRAGYLPSPNNEGGYSFYGYHGGVVPLRPMVKVHPDTGRTNLCIGRHAHNIVGMDPADSERFIDDINERSVQPQWMHFHEWEAGDVVVWDNRRLLHCAVPFDLTEPRRMWHTRIAGDPVTELALNYDSPEIVPAP